MVYKVSVTPQAIEQIQDTIKYIKESLQSPEIAKVWSSRIRERIRSLNYFPYRFSRSTLFPDGDDSFRRMIVEPFVVYYWIDEAHRMVWITNVIHARRDQLSAIGEKETPDPS